MTFTLHHAQPILDVIGKHESRGDYDIVYGGIPASMRPTKLTAMTVQQVQAWQADIRRKGVASTAAGKYQIIYNTLGSIIAQMGFDTSRKFDATAQDEMGMHLLKGRGFQRFLDGQIDTDDMMLGLAKEWASLPVPDTGRSYYAGDGLNKAHASIAEVEQALAICRERYASGEAPVSDIKPATGFLAILIDFLKQLFGGKT